MKKTELISVYDMVLDCISIYKNVINVPIKKTCRSDHKAKHNCMVHMRIISKAELLREVECKMMGMGILDK